jgi:ribonuclease P protein component
MIASQFRLSGQSSFDRVLKNGRVYQAQPFGLAFFNREDEEISKYGYVVSLKVSKLAVQRNRIKRALSEATRYLTSDVKKGFDVVFLAKQSATKISTDQIMRDVREAFAMAGLLK